MAYAIPWNLMGLLISGDFADLTIYTDRFGRKNVFPRSPPKEPPTPLQVTQRQRFAAAVAAYKALTAAEKAAYEAITKKTSCCLTGQNLFIKVALKHQLRSLTTMRNQTGISVPNPPYL